jgi:hypothetical protein
MMCVDGIGPSPETFPRMAMTMRTSDARGAEARLFRMVSTASPGSGPPRRRGAEPRARTVPVRGVRAAAGAGASAMADAR